MSQPIPDPKLHQLISFVKSALRIVAGIFLVGGGFHLGSVTNALIAGGLFLILAELLGVAEELV